MQWARKQTGFTIVELLIVVVVIAILAAITIVAYNGITNRAKSSAVQADITNAAKKLETLKLQDTAQQYPATLTAAGITASAGNTFEYDYSSTDNSYCLHSTNGTIAWHASSSDQSTKTGVCGSDSLIGNWSFNGNANDSSGNNLNGTVSGATLTTGRNGQANGAYLFSGATPNISMGNSTLFDVPNLTMSIWANTSNPATTSQTLIAKEGKQKYRISGGTSMGMLASTTTGWTHTQNCSFTFSAGTWYHIVYTVNSSTGFMKLFVNGNQVCEAPGPVITGYNTNPVVVGSYNVVGTEVFVGTLDDARFYNRALSNAEVKALYDLGAQ